MPPPPAESLTARTAAGAGWMVGWRVATRVLGAASTLVLVRILAPEDFGLVALATSLTSAVDWFASIGVREALIRDPGRDRPLYDTGFTLNLLRGGTMAAAVVAGAWPAAWFFRDPRLVPIMLVLALTLFLMALENIGSVDFRRDLAFRKEFRLAIVPRAVSILAALGWAVVFADYWALVVGIVTNRVLRVVLSYAMHPYRPRLSLVAWRRIAGFSFWTWLIATIVLLRDRADAVVIGRVADPAAVGVYAVGAEIGALPSTELVEPLTAALFAGFAAGRRSGADVGAAYLKVLSATFLLTLPMGVGLSLLAAPLVHLAFGERWMAAVPLVQVFAVLATVKVIASIGSVLLDAHGRLRSQVAILLAALALRLVLLLALVPRVGLLGAALAAAGCVAVEETLYLRLTFRSFALRGGDLVRASWRGLAATLLMIGVLWAQGIAWAAAPAESWAAAGLIAQGVATGAATYGLAIAGLWLCAGRPRGAETTFVEIVTPMLLRRRAAG